MEAVGGRKGPLRMRDLLPQLKALGADEEGDHEDRSEQPQTPSASSASSECPGVSYRVPMKAVTPRSARGRSTPLKMRQPHQSTGKRSAHKPAYCYSLFEPRDLSFDSLHSKPKNSFFKSNSILADKENSDPFQALESSVTEKRSHILLPNVDPIASPLPYKFLPPKQTRDQFTQTNCQPQIVPKQTQQMSVKGRSYSVLGKLGSGGSSQVYKVMEPDSGYMFAVKCVDMAVDASVAESYINEIKLLQRLQGSDRVITMFDYEYIKQHKKLYVLLEMGDVDLSSLLKSYRAQERFLPFPVLVCYWTEMLTAVEHIHKNGIIHSDLKPANFILVHGRLKLIDFGIASSLNADATSVLKDSTVGSFNYISPEAITLNGANCAAKVSYKSDVWSLGCILYSMLYGRTPFGHVKQLYAKIAVLTNPNQTIDYPPLKGVPPVLTKALKWCLTFDPKKRPTVQDLLDLSYLNNETVSQPIREEMPLDLVIKIKSLLNDDEWQKFVKVMGANR